MLTSASPSLSQSKESFFEKNYAKNPLEASKEMRDQRSETDTNTPESISENNNAETESLDSKFITDDDLENPDQNGIEIKWLGLIVSTKDSGIINNALSNLGEIVKKHQIKVGYIYLVGAPTGFQSFGKKLPILVENGAVIKFVQAVPDKYEIKRTPSWIVATEKGEILLDGVVNISGFLNSNGELLDTN